MEPYTDKEALPEYPKPQIPLREIGVKRWQHDLWIKIIEAALAGKPDQVAYDWHPALKKPALSRYGATSPELLKWMGHWNEGKSYSAQIRPFWISGGTHSPQRCVRGYDRAGAGRPTQARTAMQGT